MAKVIVIDDPLNNKIIFNVEIPYNDMQGVNMDVRELRELWESRNIVGVSASAQVLAISEVLKVIERGQNG